MLAPVLRWLRRRRRARLPPVRVRDCELSGEHGAQSAGNSLRACPQNTELVQAVGALEQLYVDRSPVSDALARGSDAVRRRNVISCCPNWWGACRLTKPILVSPAPFQPGSPLTDHHHGLRRARRSIQHLGSATAHGLASNPREFTSAGCEPGTPD